MADLTGKDTPSPDPKNSSKTGPVKPPVLEGTVRPTGGSAKTETGPAEKSAPKPAPKPSPAAAGEAPASGGGAAWLAGLLGGAIGLGAAYGLAWFGLWPQPVVTPPPADPRIAQLATVLPELETVTGTVQDELSKLTARVATLETTQTPAAAAAPATADPAVTEQLAAFASRLDALTQNASADPETLAAFQADLAALRDQVKAAETQLAAAQQQIIALSETADSSASEGAAAVRLPLIFSALEDAFTSGRPYETELAALRQALPDLLVPESVAGRATTGQPRPDVVQTSLTAALPDILAGRPIDAQAGWQGATLDWFRGLVAMRPSGAVEGDGPDAVVARLESAVAARDFATAMDEIEALPDPMKVGAQRIMPDIESLASAQTFLAQLRQQALSAGSNR